MKIDKYVTDIFENKHFEKTKIDLSISKDEEFNIINIYTDNKKQEWKGLGGALTGATIYNLNKLNEEKQKEILEGYFCDLNYNYIRLPIGSTDFSIKSVKDYHENFDENIKYLEKIKKIKDIRVLATPWTPPINYKTGLFLTGGSLKKSAYLDYTNYLLNFINDYKQKNINIDYLSVQNEPFAKQFWESCQFTIEELNDFTYNYLLPKLTDTKIVLWDHNKENLYKVCKALYKKDDKIAAIGFHWYSGGFYDEMDLVKDKYPQLLLIETEMCCGFSEYDEIGWINDAEHYLNEILKSIHYGLNMFFDWNMLLNYKGGPNHKHNYCKSPLILNKEENDYIKTPIYYYLRHIGMVGSGNVLQTSSYDREGNLDIVAIDNGQLYITVLNKSSDEKTLNIKINDTIIKDKISRHSIITYVV